ncbi:MAG TPA: ankyrin repeat domain-containing protein [Pyrinomonadaceae bacterium]|nr:ankyrin repeat domain-containing protein [Pyrinomonadaceae bacterium]
MSATAKQQIGANAATNELWRIAESGDVDELSRVFMNGAHVNARNDHGMTPLMKAASEGHAQMVRALLERGADPNLARNDKFTALALAAFFGHTETVKILIAHGARREVVTRCGASAETWAIRRTFAEAAHCLKTRAPKPAPAPAPVTAPAVIKTLKDPPEIWDLVHEEPRGFNAGSAFVSRLKSMRTSFTLRVAAVVVVSAAFVISVLVFRGSQARSLSVDVPASQSVVATEVSAPVNVENTKSDAPVDPSTAETNEVSHHSSKSVDEKPSRKVVLTRQARSRAVPDYEPVQNASNVQSSEVPAAAPVIATPQVEARKPSSTGNTSLSPQVIAPAKSTPPKGKVIQWP